MELIKLFSGIGLLVVFTWLLLQNSVRKGFIPSLFRLDIAIGMIAEVTWSLLPSLPFWPET